MVLDEVKGRLKGIKHGTGLASRLARGSVWLGAGNGVEHGLRFVRNMILTRLLAPELLGVMAIIHAVNALFSVFTQIGVREAIVQSPRAEERTYLNGAWFLSLARSILLFSVAYLSAPWVARFYEDPDLVVLLRFAFLSPLFLGALSPRAYLALKRMQYGRWVAIFQGGGVCGVLTTIVLAFMLRGIWALVIGFVVEAAARFVLSFVICPFRPGLGFDRQNLAALFRYVRGIFGLSIFYFVYMRADVFVVGKLCSEAELGLYSMAVALAQIPASLVMGLMDPLLMPAFSEMQSDARRINRGILTSTTVISSLGLPMVLLVALYGREILALAYGPRYMVVAVPFALLFATTVMRICSAPIVSVYLAIGRPELQRLFSGVRALAMLAFIYPAVKWRGLAGASAASLVAMSIAYVFQVVRLRRVTGLGVWSYVYTLFRPVVAGLPIVAVWVAADTLLPGSLTVKIVAAIVGCLLAYGISLPTILRAKELKATIPAREGKP